MTICSLKFINVTIGKRRSAVVAIIMSAERIDHMRRLMLERNLDCLIATSAENIQYASGFRDPMLAGGIKRLGSSFCVIPADKNKEPTLIVSSSYSEITERQSWIKDQRYVVPKITFIEGISGSGESDPLNLLFTTLKDGNLTTSRIGIEEAELSVGLYHRLGKKLPEAALTNGKELFEKSRLIKSSEEIDSIKMAVEITMSALNSLYSKAREGISETDVVRAYQRSVIENGGSFAYPGHITIGTGPNSAIPLNPPTDRKLSSGDLVKADVGSVYNGYTCDFARCGVVKVPSESHKKLHDTLRRAIDKAIAFVAPRVKGREIYNVARSEIEKVYPNYAVPVIGHGVGLEEHESPTLSSTSEEELQEGMVISIEAPYNIPKVGGINLEDMMLVTKNGHELISNFRSDMVIC